MTESSDAKVQGSYLQSAINKSNMNREQVVITSVEIRPPLVTFADMNTEMKEFAFDRAEYAYKMMFKQEWKHFKDAALFLKESFDEKFGGTWNVIVGRHFGSFVSYESKGVILFWINQIGFLIYKFG